MLGSFSLCLNEHLLTCLLTHDYLRITLQSVDSLVTVSKLQSVFITAQQIAKIFQKCKIVKDIGGLFDIISKLQQNRYIVRWNTLQITLPQQQITHLEQKSQFTKIKLILTNHIVKEEKDQRKIYALSNSNETNQIYIHKKQSNKLIDPFIWDSTPLFAWKFKICQSSIERTDQDQGNHYQLTFKRPFAVNHKFKIIFQLQKYGSKDSQIYFGLITQLRKQYQFSGGVKDYHKQSLGYLSANYYQYGWINMDMKTIVGGETGEQSLYIKEGGRLIIQGDLTNWTVSFRNVQSNSLPFEVKLAKSMRDKPLYAFVAMGHYGDSIKVII